VDFGFGSCEFACLPNNYNLIKMRISDQLTILSQVINFLVFIYFIIELNRIQALNLNGLFISAFAILISVVVNIIGVFDR